MKRILLSMFVLLMTSATGAWAETEYQVAMKEGAGDEAYNWLVSVNGGGSYESLPQNVAQGTTVTAAYAGDLKVKSFKAVKKAGDNITVFFTDAEFYGDVHVYYYYENGENNRWPGTAMTSIGTNDFNQTIYKADIPASVTGIIFNGNVRQTVDITEGIVDGAWWYTINNIDDLGHNKVNVAPNYYETYKIDVTSVGSNWCFVMPDYDVELEMEYYPRATVTTEPTAVTGLAEGSVADLITKGTCTVGTLNYAIGQSNTVAPASGWSETIPTAENLSAGIIYVWYKVIGDAEHSDSQPQCIAVTLSGSCGTGVTWTLTSGGVLTISGTGAMANYGEASEQPWTAMHSDIKTIVIEDGVTSIGNYAFSLCEYVTSGVSIPASVTSIGNYSFNYCSMTSLTIPSNSSLETIGSFAFNCSGFGSVTIPASVKSIGNNAFDACTNLTTVTLNSNPSIGESAFGSAAVTMNLTANEGKTGEYWMTFFNHQYNFQADANTQVFKVALSDDELTLNEVTGGIVNAGTPVVLKTTATGGNLVMTQTSSTSSDSQSNSLTAVSTQAGVTANGSHYVLNKGTKGVGFYKLASGNTIGYGKAYLTYSGDLARAFFLFDEATGISATLNDNVEMTNDNVYDLQGRRVSEFGIRNSELKRGLYIVNGKKVVIK